jgi:hypothetical protein
MHPQSNASDLLNEDQAASVLQVKPNTLAVWRSTKRYAIPFVKIGACVRYKRADLEAFIQENRIEG